MQKLIDLYKQANVKDKAAGLTLAPFDFQKTQSEDGRYLAKGDDGVLYDVRSEAAFYNAVGANGRKYKVFAFIGKPRTPAPEGGYPAIVLAHGGGGRAYFEWVEHWVDKGYVAIAPDLAGQYGVSAEKRALANEQGAPEAKLQRYGSFFETDDVEGSWMYFGPFALGYAINALKEYAPINENKIALAGISWGGVLSLHTAAVEPRFSAVSVIYSSAFHWDTDWAMENHNVKTLTSEQLGVYKDYLDPAVALEYIQAPVLFTAGMDDAAFSTVNRKRTTELVSAQKQFSYFVHFPHGHWEGWTPKQSYAFTDAVFALSKPLVKIEATLGGAEVKIKVSDKVEKVYLAYTQEEITHAKNVAWEEVEATKACRGYKATLPTGAKAYFARYEGEDGVQMSTDVYFL